MIGLLGEQHKLRSSSLCFFVISFPLRWNISVRSLFRKTDCILRVTMLRIHKKQQVILQLNFLVL